MGHYLNSDVINSLSAKIDGNMAVKCYRKTFSLQKGPTSNTANVPSSDSSLYFSKQEADK